MEFKSSEGDQKEKLLKIFDMKKQCNSKRMIELVKLVVWSASRQITAVPKGESPLAQI